MTTNTNTNTYNPDYAVPPGETVKECMEYRGWGMVELTRATGVPKGMLHGVLDGTGEITPAMALRFSEALGGSPEFWLRLQELYTSKEQTSHETT